MILDGSGAFISSSEPATLIPLSVGLVMAVIGMASVNERWSKTLMHIGVLISFASMIFSATALQRLVAMMQDEPVSQPASVVSISILGILSLIHVTLSIRWFLARKRSSSS